MDSRKVGADLKRAREARGWSQPDLERASGVSQSSIDRIEKGQFKRRPSVLDALYAALKKTVPTDEVPDYNQAFTTGNFLVGDRNLPVFASAEAGNGAIILSSDPVEFVRRPAPLLHIKDGYGLIVVLDSMVPEFRPGDTVLVHPHLQPLRGEACVLYSDDGEGEVKAIIKSYVGQTSSHWIVEQWNPHKTIRLARKTWTKVHRIVGKYSRR